jgi:dihydroorotate dehydrogenase (NAD+) catalytic subunit
LREQEILYYDPKRSYQQNFQSGPFGEFADGERYQTVSRLTGRFLGFPIHLRLGISAGPLVNGRAVKAALDHGWDIVTYKTVRSGEHPVNGFPNLVPTALEQLYTKEVAERGIRAVRAFSFPSSPTNSFGVPSAPPEIWIEDAKQAVDYAKEGQVVVVSFQGTPKGNGDVEAFIKDHALAARLVKQTGAKVLEVNTSCPNEGNSDLLCLDYKTSGRVVEAIRAEIGGEVKLLVKICYFDDQQLLRNFVKAVSPYINGFTAINTAPARVIDHRGNPIFGLGRERSGISGEYIRPLGVDMVRRLDDLRWKLGLDISIVGVGGVFDEIDYSEYLDAGADAVETATGSLANPNLARQIKQRLGAEVVRVQ